MTLLFLLSIALSLTHVLAVPTSARDDVPKEDYRLPQIFETSHYELALTVPADAFTENGTEYTGSVKIEFSITDADAEYISLHAHVSYITINRLEFNNIDLDPEDYSINNETNILKIKIVNEIAANRTYALVIDYTGRLNTEEMYGFYKSSYVDKNNDTKYLATTQFEPTHARKAFPCFDEPNFKATYDVSITYPSTLKVLFNTAQKNSTTNDTTGLTTVNFETTPVLSTYLIAFIVSEFTCTTGNPVDGVTFQVCSRDEAADTRKRAVEVGSQVIEKLNIFTNFNYNKSMTKMDQVAIPDFSAGAMENWGLVTYREAALLWDEEESSNRYNQRITTVIAHEFTHQWFGDLVTCDWWSEIFLNEGFATYFEYHITSEVVTSDWELDKQFLVEEVHTALVADASNTSQALQSDAFTPTEISNRFDTISYNKGGSVLRMVAHILGLENFKAGLQKYLADNAYSTAVPEDLWNALDGISDVTLPATTFEEVMENWTKNPGFPLVTAKLNDGVVTLTQERFLLTGTDTDSKWYVPISYTTSEDEDKFTSTAPTAWLTPTENVDITLPENATWIIINNQQTGYYRVSYDDNLWNNIKAAVDSEDFGGIDDLNRAQLIDDLFNLARANKVKYSLALNIANFLGSDTSYYPWYAAFTGYDYLLRRVGQNKLGTAISSTLLDLIEKLYESVPFSKVNADDQIYTHKQVLALTWACRLGNENCIQEVSKQFAEYRNTDTRPDRNLRTVVYCNALRYSSDSSDWEYLWDAYLKASDLATEQVTILSALGCTKDTNLLKEYLTKTITDGSGIRSQDALSAYSSVYSGNPEGIAVAFEFLTENYEKIAEKYQSLNSLGSLIKGIAERFTTQAEINNLNDFISKENLPDAFRIAAQEALQTATANLQWTEQFEDDLNDYYGISDGAGSISASFVVILVALFMSRFFVY